MPNFTPGKWWIAPPLFDGDVIFAPPQTKDRRNEVVAMGITNRADAQLIAAAPVMYELLSELTTFLLKSSVAFQHFDKDFSSMCNERLNNILTLLTRIDGEQEDNNGK